MWHAFARTQEIIRLLQNFFCVQIFFADDIRGVMIKEPPVTAMLARTNRDFRFVRLREKQNDGVVNALIADFEIKALVRAKVRCNAHVRFFDAGLFFKLTQRRIDAALPRLEVTLRKIPIIAAAIQEQKLYPVARFAIYHKTRNHLLLGRNSL